MDSATEKLYYAVERQMLIDGLAENIKRADYIAKQKDVKAALDNLLQAWKMWSDSKKLIRAMLKVRSPLSQPKPKRTGRYTESHLIWFDGVIQGLDSCDKSLLNYEIFHSKDRRKSDKWAKQWKVCGRTYYNHLSRIRQDLTEQIVAKAESG